MASATCRRLVLMVLILFSLQCLVLLSVVHYGLPFSAYSSYSKITSTNTDAVTRAISLNQKRVDQAKGYLQVQNRKALYQYYGSLPDTGDIYLSVAIVTVDRSLGMADRKGLGYLYQSAAAIDRFARSNEFISKTFVFVCNVDKKPQMHQEAQYFKSYLPYSERYGSSSFHTSSPQLPGSNITYRQKQHNNTHEKETFDYMYCMNIANSLKPQYILMVEDDAIAHRDLPVLLKHILENHLSSTSEKSRKHFAFLKLFYPIKWQGFAFEILSLLELLSIGTVGGGLSVLCLCVFSIRWTRKPSLRIYQSYFIAGMVFFVITAEMIGRQNLLEIRRVSRYLYQFRPSPGCCTPAMLYPTSIIDPLFSHLGNLPFANRTYTDLAIQEFIVKSDVPAYFVEPNLFYHTGMFTSLEGANKKPEEFLFNV